MPGRHTWAWLLALASAQLCGSQSLGQPGTPTALLSGAGVYLTWTHPIDNRLIIGYRVMVKEDAATGSFSVKIADTSVINGDNSTNIVVGGLDADTTYVFQVAALNSTDVGPVSTTSAAVTTANLPGLPTDVTASSSTPSSCNVEWEKPASDGGAAVIFYQIIVRNVNTSTSVVLTDGTGSNLTSATVHGLFPDTIFTFTVRAVNEVGLGAASSDSNEVHTTDAPSGLYELTPDIYTKARIPRYNLQRYRVYVRPLISKLTVQISDVTGGRGLAVKNKGSNLQLYLMKDSAPTTTHYHKANISGTQGDCTLTQLWPEEAWYYIMVFADQSVAMYYDYFIKVDVNNSGLKTSQMVRHPEREEAWKYYIDPEGRSQYNEYVLDTRVNPY